MGEAKRRKLGGAGNSRKAVLTELRGATSTNEGMARFMDKLFSAGSWTYDADEDVWVTPDKQHRGAGRGFVVVKRGGDWFKAVLPDRQNTS